MKRNACPPSATNVTPRGDRKRRCSPLFEPQSCDGKALYFRPGQLSAYRLEAAATSAETRSRTEGGEITSTMDPQPRTNDKISCASPSLANLPLRLTSREPSSWRTSTSRLLSTSCCSSNHGATDGSTLRITSTGRPSTVMPQAPPKYSRGSKSAGMSQHSLVGRQDGMRQ